MSDLFALADVSTLRTLPRELIERLIETSFKAVGAKSARSHFALLDLDCHGTLRDRLQHTGCKERIAQIVLEKQAAKQPYNPEKSLTAALPTLYDLTRGNGISILLAAQESTGAPRLCNLQHGLQQHSKHLQKLGGLDDEPSYVSILLELPRSSKGIQNFLQLPAGSQAANEQLPDPAADTQAYFSAVYKRCRHLLDHCIQEFNAMNIRLVLTCIGYEASKAQQLFLCSLQLLLLTELPLGSSIVVLMNEENSSEEVYWQVDGSWHKVAFTAIAQAAGLSQEQLSELKAKIQASKLPSGEHEGDKWVQQQFESYEWRQKRPAAVPRARENAIVPTARRAKPVASAGDSAEAAGPAKGTNAAAGKRLRRAAAEGAAAAAAAGGPCPPPRQPLRPTNHQQQLQPAQPANSASVGCPAASAGGGSRRSGSQQPAGISAKVSHAARRLIAATDQTQQGKQPRKAAAPSLMAERPSGLARSSSRCGREGPVLLQPVQLGGSQEPNSSAFTGATGGSGRQQRVLGSQKELIRPVTLPTADEAPGALAAAAAGEAATPAGAGPAAGATAAAAAPDDNQQQEQQAVAPVGPTVGCLAASAIAGSVGAKLATAAVRDELTRLLAGRRRGKPLRTKDLDQLKQDLARLCEVTVRTLVQQCPDDQQQWSLGVSAAAREAAVYAKGELERFTDVSLKKLAHRAQGEGGGSEAIAAAAAAGLPTADEAAVKRSRLRQGLLILSGRGEYSVEKKQGKEMPLMVLEPMFWLLFCVHSILLVGPLVLPPLPPPDMRNDGTRWSAKTQYVSAERHVDCFIDHIDSGWMIWKERVNAAAAQEQKQQQQQQQQDAVVGKDWDSPGAHPDEQQGSQELMLFLGAYNDHYEWFNAEVLAGLETQPYLTGLCSLLSKWKNPHKRGEGSMQVPISVDYDTQHQLGDPALLGAALVQRMRQQEEAERRKRRRAMREYQLAEARRKQEEIEGAGEGVGTTDGVAAADGLLPAAAAAGGGGGAGQKRSHEDGADSAGGSATRATHKRRCTGPEVSSKPASQRRSAAALASKKPAPAVNDPLKALKTLKGLPGKNKLRLDETNTNKKQKQQKPKAPKELKDYEDDADSSQQKRKQRAAAAAAAAGGDAPAPSSGGTTAANTTAAAAAGASGGQQPSKGPNKFARVKVVKKPIADNEQDQRAVEDELAGFGIDLFGDSQPTAAAAAGPAAVAGHKSAVKKAKQGDMFGLGSMFGGPLKQQQQQLPPRAANPFSFLAPQRVPAAAAPAAAAAELAAAPSVGMLVAEPAAAKVRAAEPMEEDLAAAAADELPAVDAVPETPGEAAAGEVVQKSPANANYFPSSADAVLDADAAAKLKALYAEAEHSPAAEPAAPTASSLEERFGAVATAAEQTGASDSSTQQAAAGLKERSDGAAAEAAALPVCVGAAEMHAAKQAAAGPVASSPRGGLGGTTTAAQADPAAAAAVEATAVGATAVQAAAGGEGQDKQLLGPELREQQDGLGQKEQAQQPPTAANKKRKASAAAGAHAKRRQSGSAAPRQPSMENMCPPGRCMTRQKSVEAAPPSARTRGASKTPPAAAPAQRQKVSRLANKAAGKLQRQQGGPEADDAQLQGRAVVEQQILQQQEQAVAAMEPVEAAAATKEGSKPEHQHQQQVEVAQQRHPASAGSKAPASAQAGVSTRCKSAVTLFAAAGDSATASAAAAASTKASKQQARAKKPAGSDPIDRQEQQKGTVAGDMLTSPDIGVMTRRKSAGTPFAAAGVAEPVTAAGAAAAATDSKASKQTAKVRKQCGSDPAEQSGQQQGTVAGEILSPSSGGVMTRRKSAGTPLAAAGVAEPADTAAAAAAGAAATTGKTSKNRANKQAADGPDMLQPPPQQQQQELKAVVGGAVTSPSGRMLTRRQSAGTPLASVELHDAAAGGKRGSSKQTRPKPSGAAAAAAAALQRTPQQQQEQQQEVQEQLCSPPEAAVLPAAIDSEAPLSARTRHADRRRPAVFGNSRQAPAAAAAAPAVEKQAIKNSSKPIPQNSTADAVEADAGGRGRAAGVAAGKGRSKSRSKSKSKQQQQQEHEHEPPVVNVTPQPAAAVMDAADYLMSPADVDLENGQGEEEQPPPDDDMQQQQQQLEAEQMPASVAANDNVQLSAQVEVAAAPAAAAAGGAADTADLSSPPTVVAAGAAAGVSPLQGPSPPASFSAALGMYQQELTLKCQPPLTTGLRGAARGRTQQGMMLSPSHNGLNSRLDAAAAAGGVATPSTVDAVAAAVDEEQLQEQDGKENTGPVTGGRSSKRPRRSVAGWQQQQQQQQQQVPQEQPMRSQDEKQYGCSKCRHSINGCLECSSAKKRKKQAKLGQQQRQQKRQQRVDQQQLVETQQLAPREERLKRRQQQQVHQQAASEHAQTGLASGQQEQQSAAHTAEPPAVSPLQTMKAAAEKIQKHAARLAEPAAAGSMQAVRAKADQFRKQQHQLKAGQQGSAGAVANAADSGLMEQLPVTVVQQPAEEKPAGEQLVVPGQQAAVVAGSAPACMQDPGSTGAAAAAAEHPAQHAGQPEPGAYGQPLGDTSATLASTAAAAVAESQAVNAEMSTAAKPVVNKTARAYNELLGLQAHMFTPGDDLRELLKGGKGARRASKGVDSQQ